MAIDVTHTKTAKLKKSEFLEAIKFYLVNNNLISVQDNITVTITQSDVTNAASSTIICQASWND